MRSTIRCCQYCTDKRSEDCHSICEQYKKEKAEYEETKKKMNEIAAKQRDYHCAVRDAVKRMKTRSKTKTYG